MWNITILILLDIFKTHAKIQTNWRWLRRCCNLQPVSLQSNVKTSGHSPKTVHAKEIACWLKIIKVHFEITAWEWYTLQTACNNRQTANSELFWVTSTLSAMWVEKVQGLNIYFLRQNLISHRICPRMLATEIVIIPILYHSPCKCSTTIFNALGKDFFSTICWKKSVLSKCTLIIFNKHAICFVQYFANGPLFLRKFRDLQQRLNDLWLVWIFVWVFN
jgi:hypothetical protein